MPSCFLHADLDCFFVAVEQRRNPSLRSKSVVVGGNPPHRGVVASASYEARAYGLYAGMPLITAQRLCPQAIFLPGSFSLYQEASESFMGILSGFSPLLEPAGIDEAYLDITGFDAFYGSPRQLALKLKQKVREELGLAVSAGIAPCKVVAKIASDLSKPDGLLEVAPGEEASFLTPLPLSKLPGIGPRTEEALKRRGVYTLGQLAALPPSLVKFWLGRGGERLHLFARGIDPRKLEPPASAKSISRSTTFPRDTLEASFLQAHLRYLAERVGVELRQQGKAALSVILKLRYADFETITRQRTLKEPTDADQVLFHTGLELLEKALKERKRLVRLVGIGVAGLVATCRQLHFWDKGRERQALLNQVVDRLRHKYGYGSLQTGQTFLLRDFLPLSEEGYLLHTPSLSR